MLVTCRMIGLVSREARKAKCTVPREKNSPGRKAVHDIEKQRLQSDDDAAETQEHRRAPKDTKDEGRE